MGILDTMLDKQGIYKVDKQTVDWKAVNFYLGNRKLLDNLRNWVEFPNYDCLPGLRYLAREVDRIQPHKDKGTPLYRGMSLEIKMQNNLGIKPNDIYNNPNYKFSITLDKPTSFSTDIRIAEDFGKSIIMIQPGSFISDFLRITPELSTAMATLTKVTPTSEREWVWLRQDPVKFDTHFVKYKKPLLPSWMF